MGKNCCEEKSETIALLHKEQGTILKIVMAVNLVMFFVEFTAGWRAQSSALLADSLDMLGDAIVYGFSLYVLHRSQQLKASAALLKGVIIAGFGLAVFVETVIKTFGHSLPVAETMGVIGGLALAANCFCLALLTRFKNGDINMRSTWICSRNDIISNVGVLIAAGLVYLSGSKWPDIVLGFIISGIFLRSAVPILLEAISIIRAGRKGPIANA